MPQIVAKFVMMVLAEESSSDIALIRYVLLILAYWDILFFPNGFVTCNGIVFCTTSGGWSLPQTFDGWDPPKIVYNCKFKNV